MAGMFRPIVEIEVPSLSEDMTVRNHNAFAKEALRETMLRHHKQNIRKHFTTRNRSRYGHMPRFAKYNRWKRRKFGHEVDLVKTGASRDQMVAMTPTVQIGGAASGGKKGLTGQYKLRFAWKGGTGQERRVRSGVTTQVMLSEVSRFSDDEAREAAEHFHKAYWQKVAQWRGSRKRVRMPRR